MIMYISCIYRDSYDCFILTLMSYLQGDLYDGSIFNKIPILWEKYLFEIQFLHMGQVGL